MSIELDDLWHAPNGDPDEPEREDYDDEQEDDGRWAFSTEAGCWIYE
jgi:hypothetical protein